MIIELFKGLKIETDNNGYVINLGLDGLNIIGSRHIKSTSLRIIKRRANMYLEALAGNEAYKTEKIRYHNAPKKDCPRCKGKGYLDAYLHIAHGICFKCGGNGKIEKTFTNDFSQFQN